MLHVHWLPGRLPIAQVAQACPSVAQLARPRHQCRRALRHDGTPSPGRPAAGSRPATRSGGPPRPVVGCRLPTCQGRPAVHRAWGRPSVSDAPAGALGLAGGRAPASAAQGHHPGKAASGRHPLRERLQQGSAVEPPCRVRWDPTTRVPPSTPRSARAGAARPPSPEEECCPPRPPNRRAVKDTRAHSPSGDRTSPPSLESSGQRLRAFPSEAQAGPSPVARQRILPKRSQPRHEVRGGRGAGRNCAPMPSLERGAALQRPGEPSQGQPIGVLPGDSHSSSGTGQARDSLCNKSHGQRRRGARQPASGGSGGRSACRNRSARRVASVAAMARLDNGIGKAQPFSPCMRDGAVVSLPFVPRASQGKFQAVCARCRPASTNARPSPAQKPRHAQSAAVGRGVALGLLGWPASSSASAESRKRFLCRLC